MAKISASWRRASSWESLTGANGKDGCGCWRADVRSHATFMAASAEVVVDISYRQEENSTVLAIRLACIFVMYTLWHL